MDNGKPFYVGTKTELGCINPIKPIKSLYFLPSNFCFPKEAYVSLTKMKGVEI